MYGFKFYARHLWPQALMTVLVLSGFAFFIYQCNSSRAESTHRRESAPCVNFNDTPIQEVPARCFQYFTEHK